MRTRGFLVPHLLLGALLVSTSATPAAAERLQFDHRLYPPLQQVLDSGEAEKVEFTADNPARLVDLIATKGPSAKNWTEAMEIVSIARPRKLASARAWMAQLQQQAQARCAATFTVLAADSNSVTFERRSPDCPAEPAAIGVYRLVAGKRSWFELAMLAKAGEPDAETRRQWLAVLASAHID